MVNVSRGQKIKIIGANNCFNYRKESQQNLQWSLLNFLNNSKYDYGRMTNSLKIVVKSQRGWVMSQ